MSRGFFIFGGGNVASHLAPALVRSGWECMGVFSRTSEHARDLASRVEAQPYDEIGAAIEAVAAARDIDVVLISLTDDALHEVVEMMPPSLMATVLHTSGSTSMSILSRFASHGVLYPMQTFSRARSVDISATPFFVEYNGEMARERLRTLTADLHVSHVHELDSEKRMRLHMSAVFGCNFVNHLYAMADEVLDGTGISFDILTPLLEETLSKALTHAPITVQTGPAVRHDRKTIERHLSALEDNERLHDLYRV